MTEAEALALSTGWVDAEGLIGYLPFRAVNPLLATGRYRLWQCCAWGYILRKME